MKRLIKYIFCLSFAVVLCGCSKDSDITESPYTYMTDRLLANVWVKSNAVEGRPVELYRFAADNRLFIYEVYTPQTTGGGGNEGGQGEEGEDGDGEDADKEKLILTSVEQYVYDPGNKLLYAFDRMWFVQKLDASIMQLSSVDSVIEENGATGLVEYKRYTSNSSEINKYL